MSIKEKATNQKVILAMNSEVTTSGNDITYSEIIDTAGYDPGVYFAYSLAEYSSSAGTATFSIQEGDESNMSDAAAVPAAKLVYGDAVELSAANVAGAGVYKEAIFSNKRYVRVKVATVLGGSESLRAYVLAVVNPELLPTAQV